MTRTALLVGFVSIALVSGARAAAGGPDAAPPLDRRVVTRAIFLSLPECADDRATLDRAIDLLPRLGYENLAREARDVVGEEFDRLRALRLQWLTQALEELERQQRRMPKNNPATQTMMSISLEFKLPPPIALHPDCDSVRIQYGDCRQEIEILKAAIADIEQIQVTLFRERVCKPIWDLIRAKGPVLEQNRELNPNTRYDVLRRAVFLRLAVAGVDAVVLDNALAWIGTNYGAPWIDQERAKLLAELPRLRRLKLRWLKEVVLPGILPSGSVAITIPREVWVEDYKEAYPTDEYFSRDSVPALEYEMRV
ncbi:MAG TPA: hypothetical protein VF590_14440, partial [Isosphaeraceae bacterium]